MRVLIIEDEALAARRLEKMLKELDRDIEVVGHIEGIEDALTWFEQNPVPDLVFCDIHLSDGSCFEIFKHIEVPSPVIFATAYDEYAIQALRLNAIDYLLKPIKREELAASLQRYKERKNTVASEVDMKKLAESLRVSTTKDQRLLVKMGQSIKVIPYNEVAYFYTQDKISFAMTLSGRRFPLDFTIEKLEEMVSPIDFFRVNRQFIVTLAAIKELFTHTKSRVRIELVPPIDQEVVVSTERAGKFKKWLEGKEV